MPYYRLPYFLTAATIALMLSRIQPFIWGVILFTKKLNNNNMVSNI